MSASSKIASSAAMPEQRETLEAWAIRYGPALRRYFQKRAGAGEAEDFVQEVFLRMQTRTATQQIQNVEGYLFRIAASVLIDRYRNARGAPVHGESSPQSLEPLEEISPERVLIGRQTMDLFIAALEGLPPRTREAFVLHRFEEMTYAAIARHMGVSIKTVEKLISRAMKKLIECARTCT